MVSIDNAVIARLEKKGKKFEILVDPELAFKYKGAKADGSILNILAINEIFSDAKKGMRASDSDIREAFGDTDIERIGKIILKQGHIQLTTDLKRAKIAQRKKEIASLISQQALNPKTGLPHPMERILNAMDQAKVHITLMSAESQVDDIIKQLRPILPLSVENVKLKVLIPAAYTGRGYAAVKELGEVEKESWNADGSWTAVVKIVAGIKMKFIDTMNSIGHGEIEIKEVK